MAQARCSNGHIYDTEVYKECPYCDNDARTIDFGGNYEANDIPRQDYVRKTAPIARSTPVSKIEPEKVPKTTPPQAYLDKQDEIKKTAAVFTPKQGSDPVVGWLVCVQGKEVGMDYRLGAKTNTIGRGSEMDVKIKGDDTITSNTHAKIDYDILNNDFYLIPANNKSTIYLNKTPVYVPQKLTAYDKIRLGKTEVLFIPFCSEKFVWPEAEKNDDV